MPIAFELAPANLPERQVAAEMLERVALAGYTVIADKGLAGEAFETHMAGLAPASCAPTATTNRAATSPQKSM